MPIFFHHGRLICAIISQRDQTNQGIYIKCCETSYKGVGLRSKSLQYPLIKSRQSHGFNNSSILRDLVRFVWFAEIYLEHYSSKSRFTNHSGIYIKFCETSYKGVGFRSESLQYPLIKCRQSHVFSNSSIFRDLVGIYWLFIPS